MRAPSWAGVEAVEGGGARLHIGEAADPDEAVRVIQVAEGRDDRAAKRLLALNKFALEEFDQYVALAGLERVVAELESRIGHALKSSATWLTTLVRI